MSDLFSACGHTVRSKCGTEFCTGYYPRSGGAGLPFCRHHRCYLTIYPDWCRNCVAHFSDGSGSDDDYVDGDNNHNNDMHVSILIRSPKLIGRYWEEYTALNAHPDVQREEKLLSSLPETPADHTPGVSLTLSSSPALSPARPLLPKLHQLTHEELLRGRRDFVGARQWRHSLEKELAYCKPEAVLMGCLLWPNKPCLAQDDSDDDGDHDLSRKRMREIVDLAQARTMRWAAGEDPDDF
ncbi:hypothetical protein JDV02_000529 [Purpureocillium takamizusanense]|uniref:Uncharacterized protein n=1 Tax=Purpureocillium takamizusanense TaxID=2060973 RepID=A0A9Q8Q6C6_9HYPO|nr:uncharacterized protein JDV02_000529 [Purpureocillium takamizusanense]UNI13825.1 hypothetical protein JDV02_000529 [Purpureocillium takamizusanense]